MKKVAKIYKSFAEQEADEVRYWRQLPPEKKLEILEIIRLQYWAMRNELPGRLQRVYRIVKQT